MTIGGIRHPAQGRQFHPGWALVICQHYMLHICPPKCWGYAWPTRNQFFAYAAVADAGVDFDSDRDDGDWDCDYEVGKDGRVALTVRVPMDSESLKETAMLLR